ncbi:hypothetical protein AB0D67_16655 [Streptosporangium sp. NPDC048047]|uniref:hypothetical protein n=1 Tax=Streptosporangium sp. NPDC048047 TaxID=3155748 RepID=UPI003446FA75
MLTWDGDTLVAADPANARTVRLTPAAFRHYWYEQALAEVNGKKKEPAVVGGLALLDADGLVLLDLPGEWRGWEVRRFASVRGVPVHEGPTGRPEPVRVALARRAPGWTRLTGRSRPRPSGRRRIAVLCLGVGGLLVMAYVTATLGGAAWRALSWLGRLLLDGVEHKWVLVVFGPLALLTGPLRRGFHRLRVKRGAVLGPPGGPFLFIRRGDVLRIHPAPPLAADRLAIGLGPRDVAGLLLYRYESLRGLFVFDVNGRPLRHLPGPWPPEETYRFAVRHGLGCEIRALSREEYLDLTARVRDALP